MSLLPEEFPVVLAIFLALGAWRIAQKQVLTRRMPAVEILGSATVLCVDKTGTLTLNRMSVSRLYAGGMSFSVPAHSGEWRPGIDEPLPEAFHELAEFSILASQQDPFDPMEKALRQLGEYYLAQTEHIHRNWRLVREYPLSPALLALSHVWKSPESESYVIAAKGAPEAITELCHLDEVRIEELSGQVSRMADDGLRVLGVAKASFHQSSVLPSEQHDFAFEFIGLIGLADPVRPMVAGAVQECYTAGIRVAMTGDGVNDAPALKSAHIGIAMGKRGTDVAREAAALVLLDDDFSSIVQAVKLGRRIYDNIRKALTYVLAIHVPIAGISLIPLLLGLPLILFPVQIVFLELIIDPASSIVFEMEPGNPNLMQRPPRDPNQRMFGRSTLLVSLLQGASVLLSVLAIYLFAFYTGLSQPDLRAMVFTTLVIGNLSLIFVNRSQSRPVLATLRTPNAALWWITAGVLIALGFILYVPFLQDIFGFTSPRPLELLLSVAAGLVSVLWFELYKVLRMWRN